MKNKIIALFMILVAVFSISSCAVVPAYDASELVVILENEGYEILSVDEKVQEGVIGYIYGSKEGSGDEIYYIYFENFRSASVLYRYIQSKKEARIAELKMEIEKVEFKLYKTEGVTTSEKGDYYEKYVELTEALEAEERYSCGRGFNVVWYGTKQAIMDIRLG